MSELERIKQAMSNGEHTDGDLAWCVDRIVALRKRLEAVEGLLERWCFYYTDGMSDDMVQNLYLDSLEAQEKGDE